MSLNLIYLKHSLLRNNKPVYHYSSRFSSNLIWIINRIGTRMRTPFISVSINWIKLTSVHSVLDMAYCRWQWLEDEQSHTSKQPRNVRLIVTKCWREFYYSTIVLRSFGRGEVVQTCFRITWVSFQDIHWNWLT